MAATQVTVDREAEIVASVSTAAVGVTLRGVTKRPYWKDCEHRGG